VAEDRVKRRLAAILADVVGHSGLIDDHEEGTPAALAAACGCSHSANGRRAFLATAAGGFLAVASQASSQPATKQWRIGFIANAPASTSPEQARLWEVFLAALRTHGYIEGTNITIERRYHGGKIDRFPQLVAELVQAKVDVLLVGSGPGVRAAKEATATIPIVMTGASDPVGAGLVASLAHPGGNVTGIADYQVDLIPKRLELLKVAVPSLRRIVNIFGNFGGFDAAKLAAIDREQDAAAQALGVTLARVQMNTPEEFGKVASAVLSERPDALLLSPNPTNFLMRRDLAEFARRQGLPSMAGSREHVSAGIMMSYGVDTADILRTLARFVDRILKGVNPGDLPVEQPTKFDLVVNLKTATALGLTIPPAILAQADEVIE
jgi:putative ABC transport system substrate-binding protein